jgi:hypothetical protein
LAEHKVENGDVNLPAVCDFSVTNVCNAACDFCGFARNKTLVGAARYVDAHAFLQALPMDWNLDIWRCEAWSEPMGSVFDLDRILDEREHCNACMMACYRNASMLMHAAVAATDAARALAGGQIGTAVASLFRRSVAQSIWALVEETPKMRRQARRRKRAAAENAVLYDCWPSNERTEP